MLNPLVILVASMAFSMLIIPVMWRAAPALGFMDAPDARKVHSTPVARVGGWGIVIGALIPLFFVLPMDRLVQSYLFGSVVLFLFGTWDDRTDAGHYVKFIGQFIAVLAVVFYGDLYVERLPLMGLDTLDPMLGKAFTVFAIVGLINAINHSDGLDGLAGGESLLSLIAIGFLAHTFNGTTALLISVAAIGGILGFLRYNTHPAQVFMGDNGSQFLGFTLGFLAVLLTQKVNPVLSPALPALLLGLPIMDILAVFYLRASSGLNWFKATRNHIHHRLLFLGLDHYETVIFIYAIQASFVLGAIFLQYHSDVLILAIYLGTCAALFAAITVLERKQWQAHQSGSESRLAALISTAKNHPMFKTVPVILTAVLVPVYFLGMSATVTEVPRDIAMVSAVMFLAALIDLIFSSAEVSVVGRFSAYVAAIFVVYLGITYPPIALVPGDVLDWALFAGLAAAIALAVRYGDGAKFQTTPMDYLIVFAIIAIGVVATRFSEQDLFGIMVIKGAILLYACEVLLIRSKHRINIVLATSVVTLGIVAYRGLLL